jgi:hypothetical protein
MLVRIMFMLEHKVERKEGMGQQIGFIRPA